MKNKIRLILLVMLFTSVITSSSLVNSNQLTVNQDDEPTDDEVKKAYEREVQIEHSPEKVQIESQLKNGDSKDILKILFQASGDAPEIELIYNAETNDTNTDLRYKVKFQRIVEYKENGTEAGFQLNEEVSSYDLKDDATWNDVGYTNETVGGETINVFNASTTDGVFTLLMKMSSAIINLENTTFTPNSLKIDVAFKDYPYLQEDTSLALETKVKSVSKQEVELESDEELQGFGNNETQVAIGGAGFFSWVEYADADGTNIDVHASSLTDNTAGETGLEAGESSGRIYFSFLVVNASEIVWDPKVGVQSAGTATILSSTTQPPASSSTTATTTTSSSTTPVVSSTTEESDDSSAPFVSLWLVMLMVSGLVIIRRKLV